MGEFSRRMKKSGGVSSVVELSCEPSKRPCPPPGKGFHAWHTLGQDRQTKPHKVDMMVTVAGISIAPHCHILLKMPDLWVGWELSLEDREWVMWC